jgi:lysine 2,3-aminomutase
MESGIEITTSDWKDLLQQSIQSPKHLSSELQSLEPVIRSYPMLINPYFLRVCQQKGKSLWKQVLPDIQELDDPVGLVDPLAEERDSPVPNVTHRYPDRVLFLVSNRCGIYCRFCTRKRKIGLWKFIADSVIENGIRYIAEHRQIKDVLLSGGDPLLLEDERLEWILSEIRDIPHVDIIRIGSRVPGVLPQRVTPALVDILRAAQPLYLNVHFNHVDEITPDVRACCLRLANAGISMGSQTVLLKDINDNADALIQLFRELLKIRIKPYYLLQGDLTRGTNHFRTRIETGLELMRQLRGTISGLAVPQYVIDLPGGGGKIPLVPDYIVSLKPDYLMAKNFEGKLFHYEQTRECILSPKAVTAHS